MALRGCCGFLKYIIVVVNLFFWLAGLLILGLATWLIWDPRLYVAVMEEDKNYYLSLYVLLVIGALMFIIGFLGCTGACRESQCMLVLFFCVLLLIVVAQIAAGAWAYSHEDRLDALIEEKVMSTVRQDYTENTSKAFDNVQQALECCGAKSPLDWAVSRFNQKNPDGGLEILISSNADMYRVPTSCCLPHLTPEQCSAAVKMQGAVVGVMPNSKIFTQGCTSKILELKKENRPLIAGICLGVLVLEFLGLLFSIILCCAIRAVDRYKA